MAEKKKAPAVPTQALSTNDDDDDCQHDTTPAPDSQLLADALSYSARGWRVLPVHSIRADGRCTCGRAKCKSPGKHPKTKNGVKDATKEEGQIKAWWKRWPSANIGIATGAESGLVVLDVDTKDGKDGEGSLRVLEAEHGKLPDTAESCTGGGGRHEFYQYPGGATIGNAVGLAPGLDVRGEGGYVCAPPSLHASGRRYEWEIAHGPNTKLAAWPKWLLNSAAQAPAAAGKANGNGDELARIRQGVRQGERNSAAAKMAGLFLSKGNERADVDALMATWNALNQPPLEPDELAAVTTSIARRELLKDGALDAASMSREETLAFLSERFGVRIRSVACVEGTEPQYLIHGDGEICAEISASALVVQLNFARAVAAAFHKIPKTVGGKKSKYQWPDFANMLMALATPISAGAEATDAGQLRAWVQNYLAGCRPTPPDEELVTKSGPSLDARGHVLICLQGDAGLLDSLRAHDVRISSKRLAQRLAAAGFTRYTENVVLAGGYKKESRVTTRSTWIVPDGWLVLADYLPPPPFAH